MCVCVVIVLCGGGGRGRLGILSTSTGILSTICVDAPLPLSVCPLPKTSYASRVYTSDSIQLLYPYPFQNCLFITCVQFWRFTILACLGLMLSGRTSRLHTIRVYTSDFIATSISLQIQIQVYPYKFKKWLCRKCV